jgi:pyruvate ferredoxin oxidoreductase beta subunit
VIEGNTLVAGHNACAGCGEALGARLVMEAAGDNVIVTTATGCLEVFSTNYPQTAWRVAWLHSLFENSSAVASGIDAGLIALGKREGIKIIAQGGDGATADIGVGPLSGMLERGHDILYICYDNEAYMNTGIQRSGLTPFDANTTTSPPGKHSFGNWRPKKDMPAIALGHHAAYVGTATVGWPIELQRKVKRALEITGPKYMQIHVPCPLGWRHASSDTIQVAKLAVETGLFPIFDYEDGELVKVRKPGKKLKPVEEYLKVQGRFKHLFATPEGKAEIAKIQAIADTNIERYGLA